MTGTKYLSELVDFEKLYVNVVNIILAPTGSGKTYFALHTIPEVCKDPLHQALYLIDTTNGKEQILRNYNARPATHKWIDEVGEGYGCAWETRDEQVVIMTYALLGCILQTKPDFCKKFTFIICDELHNLIAFSKIKPIPNNHTIAKIGLEQAVTNDTTTVIALTATPRKIYSFFNAPTNTPFIDIKELRCYETKNTVKYSSLRNLIMGLDPKETGICYTKHVRKILEILRISAGAGLKPIAIWSTSNTNYSMSEEQLRVRSVILEECIVPPEYNFLIINSSSETSIKIKSKVDYVIVNSSDTDIQIQVRGRVNSDLNMLYLPADAAEMGELIQVPKEFLGKELYSEEKERLSCILDLKDKNGRQLKWNSIKKMLLENGDYEIVEKRRANRRYAVITKTEE